MKQMGVTENNQGSKKEPFNMNKAKLRKKRLKSLDQGKIKSLGLVEKWTMKYVGWLDGRDGLLRCNTDGVWESSVLKQEKDAYEEFCAKQMAVLKLEEEDEFKKMNILFDEVVPLRKKLMDAKEQLNNAMDKEIDLSMRKDGEENLTEAQVAARRNRERDQMLHPLKMKVAKYEKELSDTVGSIFSSLSQVRESFDSTMKIMNRILQHSQRRMDVYWRSAMRYIPELSAQPEIVFSNQSAQAFAGHFEKIEERAEKLRMELASELYGEGM